jgi:hypothetical protein
LWPPTFCFPGRYTTHTSCQARFFSDSWMLL